MSTPKPRFTTAYDPPGAPLEQMPHLPALRISGGLARTVVAVLLSTTFAALLALAWVIHDEPPAWAPASVVATACRVAEAQARHHERHGVYVASLDELGVRPPDDVRLLARFDLITADDSWRIEAGKLISLHDGWVFEGELLPTTFSNCAGW